MKFSKTLLKEKKGGGGGKDLLSLVEVHSTQEGEVIRAKVENSILLVRFTNGRHLLAAGIVQGAYDFAIFVEFNEESMLRDHGHHGLLGCQLKTGKLFAQKCLNLEKHDL